MRPFQSLTLEAMSDILSSPFRHIPDPRRADRVDDSLHDTLMRGFAIMFFKASIVVSATPGCLCAGPKYLSTGGKGL
jgi:hypothetical protein